MGKHDKELFLRNLFKMPKTNTGFSHIKYYNKRNQSPYTKSTFRAEAKAQGEGNSRGMKCAR